MIRWALIAWVVSIGAVWAEQNVSIYPAAQCAAFWAGYADYARASAHLEKNPGDDARADAFRAVALRLATASPEEIDRHIAEQRPLMVSMLDGVIRRGDGVSRRVFERLTKTCETFAATHPETQALR